MYRELRLRHTGFKVIRTLQTYVSSATEVHVLTRVGYFARHNLTNTCDFRKNRGVSQTEFAV